MVASVVAFSETGAVVSSRPISPIIRGISSNVTVPSPSSTTGVGNAPSVGAGSPASPASRFALLRAAACRFFSLFNCALVGGFLSAGMPVAADAASVVGLPASKALSISACLS